MLLIGLLAVALVALVIGLVLASGIWLIVSLVASAAAGYVLWRERERIGAKTGIHKDQAAPKTAEPAKPKQASLATGTAIGKSGAAPAASAKQATEQDVWVVDGLPQFHNENCAAILNLDHQAVPLAQAVEDGFSECTVCKPVASATQSEQVWVVDGRPDYHVQDCRSLTIAAGQSAGEAQQIPRAQAVEDGFSPCPDCRPDGAAPADAKAATPAPAAEPEPAPAPEPAPPPKAPETVWVVDGRPRYHLAECMIIKDQDAEEVPFAQAKEDGFMACSMCEPNVTRV